MRRFLKGNPYGLSVFLSLAAAAGAAEVRTASPDGGLVFTVSIEKGGRLSYRVERKNAPVIESSPLGITVGGEDLGLGIEAAGEPIRSSHKASYPWRGVHSTAWDVHNAVSIPLLHRKTQTRYRLEVRVFRDAAAFRYVVAGKGERVVSGETTAFTLPDGAVVWFQTNTKNYEGFYEKRKVKEVKKGVLIGPPLLAFLPARPLYLAITEASCVNYSGMTLKSEGGTSRRFRAAFEDDKSWTLAGDIESPWRLVMISETLNGLVNSDAVHNLCPPAPKKLREAPWIRPGRAVWSWWSQGTGDLALNKRYVDLGARLGFEYNLVDAGWEKWKDGARGKWELIRELVDYARSKGVDIWLWKHYSGIRNREARREFLSRCHEAGAVGVKIDFMDSESKTMLDFYEAALKDATEGRKALSDEEMWLYYEDTPWSAFTHYIENLTMGTGDPSFSLIRRALVQGTFQNAEAIELLKKADSEFEVFAHHYRLGEREEATEEDVRTVTVVVTEEDVERGKPHPDAFLLAAERCGVDPKRCVVIEDAPSGLAAARAAGMKCIGVAGTRKGEELHQADLVVDSLMELDVMAIERLLEGGSDHR